MSTTHDHPGVGTAPRRGWHRAVGAAWVVGAMLVAVPTYLLLAVSDHAEDRVPGLVLLVMVVAAAGTALGLLARPVTQWRTLSLLTSALWLAGAVVVYPTQEFAADAAWAAGVPAAVAVVCGALTLGSWRARDVERR